MEEAEIVDMAVKLLGVSPEYVENLIAPVPA